MCSQHAWQDADRVGSHHQCTKPSLACYKMGNHFHLACHPVQSNFAALTQSGTAPSLGARRRLVVLRCPRVGSAQQAGLDDAVAASLSLLPACAAAINLQSLAGPTGTAPWEQEEGVLLGAPASAAQPALAAGHNPAQPGEAVADEAARSSAQPPGSAQQVEQSDMGGLSAYLSSWFGSPSKPG